ncbi:hypothetical protein OF001_U40082 [Pseudomonas sp. OF001]|nr:hypothetical protein OF001_U40082 [Pseudomonas sp. OF001]
MSGPALSRRAGGALARPRGLAYNRRPEHPWHSLPYAMQWRPFRRHAAMLANNSSTKAPGEQV